MGGRFHDESNLWGSFSKNFYEVGGRFENLLSFLKMAGPPHKYSISSKGGDLFIGRWLFEGGNYFKINIAH